MTEQNEEIGKKIFPLTKAIPVKQKGGGDLRISEIEIETDLRLKHLEMMEKRSPRLRKLIQAGENSKGSTTLLPSEFIPVISVLSGLQENTVREISLTDLEGIAEIVSGVLESFFGPSPRTGKKSRGA